MAEYIRFRWTRAKAGVTMAFLALLGGLVEKTASADAAHASSATSAPLEPKLSLNGIKGNLRESLTKLDKSLGAIIVFERKAINSDIAEVYGKVRLDYYDKDDANSTFLTDKDATLDYLSKDDANSTFLTDKDATLDYLSKDGIAANSSELGGLSPQAFLHGDGGVATGTATATITDGNMPLVESADNSLTVTAALTGNGQQVTITNNTASPIDWISGNTHGTIGSGGKHTIALGTPGSVAQATVQFLPAVQNQAFTLIVSTEPGAVGSGAQRFVAQMINGTG